MKLAYVCTNLNNSAETMVAIDSLLANPSHEYRCIVVDNQSRADEAERLRRYADAHPNVDVLFNRENLGYFPGLNVGLEYLQREAPDFVHAVVGNNDLEFPARFGDDVQRNAALFRTYPVVSPSIVNLDGEHQNPHVIKGISPLRECVYDLYYTSYGLARIIQQVALLTRGVTRRGDEEHHTCGREIVQGHGSCYLFGPRFFAEVKRLWAPTFLFGEEFCLSKQLADLGHKIYYEPSISLVHVCHASIDRLPSKRRWEMARDAHRLYRNYNPIRSAMWRGTTQ
jgi:GT2 family glycosyltransferase